MNVAVYSTEPVLPWTDTRNDDRFKRIFRWVIIFFIVFGLIIPFLPVPETEQKQLKQVSPRLARLITEKRQQPKPKPVQKKEITRPLTALEKLDMGQLRLTAIIVPASGVNAMAMVEERKTRKGYVVRKGTYMGTNSGQVVEIQNDRIIIEEEISIGGNVETRQRELKLQKPSGEQ